MKSPGHWGTESSRQGPSHTCQMSPRGPLCSMVNKGAKSLPRPATHSLSLRSFT